MKSIPTDSQKSEKASGKDKAIGIKDVARLAGVSPATVSRALGGGPVSEALKQKVEDAVRASGYRPNLAARRLRSQHSGTIGLIVADICNPFFTAVSRAVEETAYRSGLRVIFCNSDEDPEREAMYLKFMVEERISGLILAPTRSTNPGASAANLDCPVTLIDRVGRAATFDSVALDNQAATHQLVDHLVSRGFRRIGGLFGNTSSTGIARRDGFIDAMARHGLTAEIRELSPSAAAGEAAAHEWLAQEQHPQALIASNSLLLMGIVKAARQLGKAIPEDLAVAGFDNEAWTDLVEPGITVIAQPTDEIGRNAMALLNSRMESPQQAVRKVVLSGELIARGSTEKPR